MRTRSSKTSVVLLVEDDPGDQELTRRALTEGVSGVNLRIVSDGEEALDYLYHRGAYGDSPSAPAPDLILLDLNLPKLDGRGVLMAIRSDASLRSLPVVVLTTSDQEVDIVRSYNLGCNSFITKPVDPAAFVAVAGEISSYWFDLVRLPRASNVGV